MTVSDTRPLRRTYLIAVISTSFDLTLLPPTVSYVFLLAAKALLRFADAANQAGDAVSAKIYASEIEVFRYGTITLAADHRLALHQYGQRHQIGVEHAKSLGDLVVERDRLIGYETSTRESQICTATIEDAIQPMQIPSAVGFMKIPLTPRPYMSETPNVGAGVSSSSSTRSSEMMNELSSIAYSKSRDFADSTGG